MSKLRCLCGYIITDQAEDLPYKAEYIADADFEESYGKFIHFIAKLLEEGRQLGRSALLAEYFGKAYPQDVSAAGIVSDALTSIRVAFGHTMYECENCGRLWLQLVPGKNNYVPYLPETEARGVLVSRKRETPMDENL